MRSWFERLFGVRTRPIRRDTDINVTADGSTVHAGRAEWITRSPEGSIDRTRIASFYACGCSTNYPVGGICSDRCQKIVCDQHLQHCMSCLRSLCPQCTFLFTADDGRDPVPHCHACFGFHTPRRRLFNALVRIRAYLEEL